MNTTSAEGDQLIETGLRRIRILRIWLVGSLLGMLPFFWVMGAVVKAPEWILSVLAVLFFLVWTVLVIVHGLARCPACHRFFNMRLLYGNPCTPKCLNCGLQMKRTAKANQASHATSEPAPGAASSSREG
jgi:Zn ribbon nucleic-acid-binding protein